MDIQSIQMALISAELEVMIRKQGVGKYKITDLSELGVISFAR